MIALRQYREYWEAMVARVEGLNSALPLTVEASMADKVARMKEEQSPALFYMPPSAEGKGRPDAFAEENMCVVFVMKKYNPKSSTSAEALEDVQPVAEKVKELLLLDGLSPCHFLKAEGDTFSTVPETEFFGNWAGWSVAFTVRSRQVAIWTR